MKYAARIGSFVMISSYVVHTKFHQDRLRHSKVDSQDTQTHREQGDLIRSRSF
jgi:hypothetical protein